MDIKWFSSNHYEAARVETAEGHDEVHSEEELRLLVSESYKNGEINQSEYKYVNKIFEFDDRIAKEIMVPRTEMNIISKEMPAEEALQKCLVKNIQGIQLLMAIKTT